LEELFGLLEEEEEQETQMPEIRERKTAIPVGETGAPAGSDFLPEENGTVSVWRKEAARREEYPDPDARQTNGNGRMGDLAQRILETVERAAGHAGEPGLQERNAGFPSRKAHAEELWYEDMGLRFSGVERLYREIGANRLQGLERERRNVVVSLGEAEQKTDGDAPMDIRTLDRVFQRDARRYDGGLSPL